MQKISFIFGFGALEAETLIGCAARSGRWRRQLIWLDWGLSPIEQVVAGCLEKNGVSICFLQAKGFTKTEALNRALQLAEGEAVVLAEAGPLPFALYEAVADRMLETHAQLACLTTPGEKERCFDAGDWWQMLLRSAPHSFWGRGTDGTVYNTDFLREKGLSLSEEAACPALALQLQAVIKADRVLFYPAAEQAEAFAQPAAIGWARCLLQAEQLQATCPPEVWAQEKGRGWLCRLLAAQAITHGKWLAQRKNAEWGYYKTTAAIGELFGEPEVEKGIRLLAAEGDPLAQKMWADLQNGEKGRFVTLLQPQGRADGQRLPVSFPPSGESPAKPRFYYFRAFWKNLRAYGLFSTVRKMVKKLKGWVGNFLARGNALCRYIVWNFDQFGPVITCRRIGSKIKRSLKKG